MNSPRKMQKSKLDPYAEALDQWFGVEKLTLQAVQARLLEQNCTISIGRLAAWWEARQSQQLQDRILERIATGAQFTSQVDTAFAANPAPGLKTLADLLKVLIMRLSVQGETDPTLLKLAVDLMRPVMEQARLEAAEKDRDLEERRVKLLETKAAQADEAKRITESALTPEDKLQKMKQVFGM